MSDHVHAIPEITYWSSDIPVSSGGRKVHACWFCRPHLYDPMPKNCTLCARCGVFIWTGQADPMNEAGVVCPTCDEDIAQEVAS